MTRVESLEKEITKLSPVEFADPESTEREKAVFFELANQLTQSSIAVEQERLKEELARMTFGDS
jgi:hypothetical protein